MILKRYFSYIYLKQTHLYFIIKNGAQSIKRIYKVS